MNADLEQQLQAAGAIMESNGETQPEGGTPPSEIELVWDCELSTRNTPLPPALIKGFINRGEVSLLAGASKAGKSWMALQMAKCIGAGIPFLGGETTPGVCVYLNTEISAPFWEQRSCEVNAKLALTEAPRVLHASTRGQEITIGNVIPLLKEAVAKKDLKTVDFICVDPYYTLAAGVDENAAGEVAMAMLGFQKLAEEMKAGVLITHHFSKGNAAGKTMLDRASGSGVFARSVDNFFTLTENSNGKMILEATRRNAASPPALEVEFDYPVWKPVGVAEAIVPKRRGRDSGYTADLILKAFPAPESVLSSDDLFRAMEGIPKSTRYRYKKQAIADGVILEQGGGVLLTERIAELKRRETGGDSTGGPSDLPQIGVSDSQSHL